MKIQKFFRNIYLGVLKYVFFTKRNFPIKNLKYGYQKGKGSCRFTDFQSLSDSPSLFICYYILYRSFYKITFKPFFSSHCFFRYSLGSSPYCSLNTLANALLPANPFFSAIIPIERSVFTRSLYACRSLRSSRYVL